VIELEVLRRVELSTSADLDLRLRGTAVLAGRVKASLGITGGVHSALDVIKANMAGAHVVQLVSALMRHGPKHLKTLRTEIEAWMLANEWDSLEEMRGNMSFRKIPNPAVYEREIFRRMFQ
jgi:dihydroorotate dehydrogenase (fumarate)